MSCSKTDTGDSQIQTWDWRFYDTQQRRTDYGVDPFEVANYFPLDSVLGGMFDLVQEMFGLEFREIPDPDVWHPDVRLFGIHDAGSGEELAHFYLDLFPREGKYGHAAEFPLVMSRRLEDGSYQNPVCAMVANFTKPTASAPSLLQHGEVETLFHEFGHVLHQNLGRTELARFAGTSVERDFVEAPSQIMQHWVWRADVLSRFARHHETGDPIPDQLVEQLVAARQLNVSIHQLRQLQYGWWDQTIHGTDTEIDLDLVLGKGRRWASSRSTKALSRLPRSAISWVVTTPPTTGTCGPKCSETTCFPGSRRRESPTRRSEWPTGVRCWRRAARSMPMRCSALFSVVSPTTPHS